MNKWLELLMGLVLIVLTVFVWGINWYGFGEAALSFLKGGIIWFMIMISIILILLGISDIKDS